MTSHTALDDTPPMMEVEEDTQLEHMCRLQFNSPCRRRRMTGIICTIGRSSRNPATLLRMMMAGMNIVRLNFSYDTHEFHAQTIQMVRTVAANYSKTLGYTFNVAIALDTKGPEIRTGQLEGNGVIDLKKNDTIRLSTNKDLMDKGNKDVVYVDYPNIVDVVVPGTIIYINDGAITLLVKEVAVDCVVCQIEVGGLLGSRKGVIVTGVSVDLPSVSEKDNNDLKFGVSQDVDFVFASGIRRADAINEIRSVLGERGKGIQIIGKIENLQSLENLEEIIAASDGIIVARADMGIEIPVEKVFLAQKALIARCNRSGKPVICSTQMFETMNKCVRPTRAEIFDVGNAILDGADCVMLSGESAIGLYPAECVEALAKTCHEAECAVWHRHLFEELVARNPAAVDAAHAVAISAVDAAKKSLASAIVVVTTSGRSAFLLSRYRPRCPILAVTRCSKTARQAHLRRGIVPIVYPENPTSDWLVDVDNRVQYGLLIGKKMEFVRDGDSVVVVTPWKDGAGFTNNMRIVYAFYQNEALDCMFKTDKRLTNKALTS